MNMWEAVTSTAGHGSDIQEILGGGCTQENMHPNVWEVRIRLKQSHSIAHMSIAKNITCNNNRSIGSDIYI